MDSSHQDYSDTTSTHRDHRNFLVDLIIGIMALRRLFGRGIVTRESHDDTKVELWGKMARR
jgi:hypothetical protein